MWITFYVLSAKNEKGVDINMWEKVKDHVVLFGLSALTGALCYFFGPVLALASKSKIGMSFIGPAWMLAACGGIAAAHFFWAEKLGIRQNPISAILCSLVIAAPQASYFLTGVDFWGNTIQAYEIVFPGIIAGILTLVALLAD